MSMKILFLQYLWLYFYCIILDTLHLLFLWLLPVMPAASTAKATFKPVSRALISQWRKADQPIPMAEGWSAS